MDGRGTVVGNVRPAGTFLLFFFWDGGVTLQRFLYRRYVDRDQCSVDISVYSAFLCHSERSEESEICACATILDYSLRYVQNHHGLAKAT